MADQYLELAVLITVIAFGLFCLPVIAAGMLIALCEAAVWVSEGRLHAEIMREETALSARLQLAVVPEPADAATRLPRQRALRT